MENNAYCLRLVAWSFYSHNLRNLRNSLNSRILHLLTYSFTRLLITSSRDSCLRRNDERILAWSLLLFPLLIINYYLLLILVFINENTYKAYSMSKERRYWKNIRFVDGRRNICYQNPCKTCVRRGKQSINRVSQ